MPCVQVPHYASLLQCSPDTYTDCPQAYEFQSPYSEQAAQVQVLPEQSAVLEVIDFNPAELEERGNINVGKTGDSLLSGVSDALSGIKNAKKMAGKAMDAVTGKNVNGVESGVLKMQFNPSSSNRFL